MKSIGLRSGIRFTLPALCAMVATATLALGVVIAFGVESLPMVSRLSPAPAPLPAATLKPIPVAPVTVDGAVVHGARKSWYVGQRGPLHAGEPVPVVITAYCLSGTTRRGRYVRSGIIAADPRFFPLSRFVELYAGSKYLGRFLVDDTGSRIRGARIDVWMPTCREAVIFGRQRGTAVLVPRPGVQVMQAGRTVDAR
jgi:3D (Asp-Asp-Asp) domain-containing protein